MQYERAVAETYCLGHHLITIPKSFRMSPVVTGIFRPDGSNVKDPAFDITVQFDGLTKAKFDSVVQERRLELSEPEGEAVKILKVDKKISDSATLFRVQEIGDSYFSELYVLHGSAIVKMRLESFRNSYLEAEKKIFELARQIKNMPVGQRGNGFCLGPVILGSKMMKESASYMFQDDHGLTFEIEIDTYGRDDPVSLLARMSGEDSLLNKFKVKHTVLRARERTVAGMQADEWLGIGFLEEDNQRTLKFALETKRKVPSLGNPIISLTFDSAQPLRDGTPTKTEISNEGAIELWDSVVNSVRFRNDG